MTIPDVDTLVAATDQELDGLFRQASTLPMQSLINSGAHRVDAAGGEILNDHRWKGFLPRGLPLRDLTAQFGVGYAKRFWLRKGRCLGETQYLDGRVTLNHRLDEVSLERQVNDLDAGRYIVLYYTDPGFEHIFHDVMKVVSESVVLYRGYRGLFPHGTRGFAAPLLRRYGLAQAGVDDHDALLSGALPAAPDQLAGRWRMDVVHAQQDVGVARLTFTAGGDGRVRSAFEGGKASPHVLPPGMTEHFSSPDFLAASSGVRQLTEDVLAGRWETDLTGAYAKLVLSGALPLFRQTKDSTGRKRFTMRYLLWRE
jgi:hypothetical protein